MTQLFTEHTLTNTRAEEIVEAINMISDACDEEIRVICIENEGPPISIVISSAELYDEIVTLGEAFSTVN
jgi:hypothetical protein